jgi:hypothetical protein
MKEGAEKTPNLEDSLVILTGLPDEKVERIGRKLYSELFLTNSRNGIHLTHDGDRVYFWERQFNHSFFISPAKELIDRSRIARMRWVLPLIQGKVPDSECRRVIHGFKPDNRLYVWLPKNFVVWLEPRDAGGWKFYTLYTVTRNQLRGYQRQGKQIWQY